VNALELLLKLREIDANPRIENGQLWLKASVLTEELRELVTARRNELVRLLTSFPCVSCGRFLFPEPDTTCFWCKPARPLNAVREDARRDRKPWERHSANRRKAPSTTNKNRQAANEKHQEDLL
jgi:hypothetical protein